MSCGHVGEEPSRLRQQEVQRPCGGMAYAGKRVSPEQREGGQIGGDEVRESIKRAR